MCDQIVEVVLIEVEGQSKDANETGCECKAFLPVCG
jgi:hypothetical protein